MTMYTRQIRRLDNQQQRQGAMVEGADWYWLRVAPSCPPDKRVHLRGGTFVPGYWGLAYRDYRYRAYTVPNLIVDFADQDSVGIDLTYTHANWYKFGTLHLQLPGVLENPTDTDWAFYLHETGDEFETAGEAESWFNSDDFRSSNPWEGTTGLPLCGLVLLNNGLTGAGCKILPIDSINRGRSYIWPSDLRPRRILNYLL